MMCGFRLLAEAYQRQTGSLAVTIENNNSGNKKIIERVWHYIR